jgi:hypothetical protein
MCFEIPGCAIKANVPLFGVVMADEIKAENSEASKKTRRAFVTTAAQVAVTAPAVAMLLSASTKPAEAFVVYPPPPGSL